LKRIGKPNSVENEQKQICFIKSCVTVRDDVHMNSKNIEIQNQTRGTVIRGLLHLVTVNGRPFSIVEDSGFNILCGSAMKEHDIRYNRRTIGNLVGQAADAIKSELAKVMNKYLVSVKVDCVTKFSRCFIGLHVQVR